MVSRKGMAEDLKPFLSIDKRVFEHCPERQRFWDSKVAKSSAHLAGVPRSNQRCHFADGSSSTSYRPLPASSAGAAAVVGVWWGKVRRESRSNAKTSDTGSQYLGDGSDRLRSRKGQDSSRDSGCPSPATRECRDSGISAKETDHECRRARSDRGGAAQAMGGSTSDQGGAAAPEAEDECGRPEGHHRGHQEEMGCVPQGSGCGGEREGEESRAEGSCAANCHGWQLRVGAVTGCGHLS